MIGIEEVIIISIDKSEDIWNVEGEIVFESDFTTHFSVDYDTVEDELLDLEIEIIPGSYDKSLLKSMILTSANEYDED